jgi:hypothetical protein
VLSAFIFVIGVLFFRSLRQNEVGAESIVHEIRYDDDKQEQLEGLDESRMSAEPVCTPKIMTLMGFVSALSTRQRNSIAAHRPSQFA